jgi:4'-phosphopantetheinyl transferase
LSEGEVHLWILPLDPPAQPLDTLYGYLAPDELTRAQRFVFQRDREHFAAARGYLRAILAQYAGCSPSEIRLGYGAHGKPYLAVSPAADGLTFNLSHTSGLGLCAVTRGRHLGVDVERIRPEVDILSIARCTFSPAEQARLDALPPALRLTAFYACWTRKEAYIKARGDGLSYPLDAFDVSLVPGEPTSLLRSAEGPAEQRRWELYDIDAGAGYAAALAVERPVQGLCLLGWP